MPYFSVIFNCLKNRPLQLTPQPFCHFSVIIKRKQQRNPHLVQFSQVSCVFLAIHITFYRGMSQFSSSSRRLTVIFPLYKCFVVRRKAAELREEDVCVSSLKDKTPTQNCHCFVRQTRIKQVLVVIRGKYCGETRQ